MGNPPKKKDPPEVLRELPEGLVLVRDERGLALSGNGMSVRGDFSALRGRLRPDNLRSELLVRAGAFRDEKGDVPLAIDAAAGLGEDAFLLAAAGWRVELYEHNPVVAELLADALARASQDPATAETAARMTLHREDSVSAMRDLPERPDIVYLDPMFPARRKSGLVGKKLQLLQKLEIPCPAEEELLQAALAAAPRRIIIKRPLKGPFLAGVRPAFSLNGKAVRFDVILPVTPEREK